MSERNLGAYINQRHVGTLTDRDGVWSFAYADEWANASDAFPLSPPLRLQSDPHVDGSSTRPVQWYFDNLLPEEGARTLLAKDAKIDVADAFGLLEHYGAESAGSLTLTSSPPKEIEGKQKPLPDADLQARITNLPRVSLSAQAAKRMSLAGAQHKLAVIYRENKLFEPVGSEPSTHILKPDHTDQDYPHTVINEYFTMVLAQRLGLDVPNVTRRYVPSPVYLVERFDRELRENRVERLHLIDACQALNLDRQFKYQQGSIERLTELANICAAPAPTRLRLYAWLVFNVMTGNADAHLKNVSFLVTKRGLSLSPAYDLLSIAVYDSRTFDKHNWPATPFAWPINGKATFDALTRGDLLEAGRQLGLSMEVATRQLDGQAARILKEAGTVLGAIEKDNQSYLEHDRTLAARFAGELRCLRAIVAVVIQTMANQLSSSAAALVEKA